jgi:hypothetical protein
MAMIGGKLKGYGTYGCVFQPALLCRGSKNPTDQNKVGKITGYADAKNELKIGKYLESIPESSNYTIFPESESCIPRAKSKQVDEDIDDCPFSEKLHLESTVQLIMPWGGNPLSRINLNPSSFNFLKFMEDVLAIGTFLIINDVCHFDVWGQNFLFDSQNKPKLIDFGFAFRPSKLVSGDLSLRWREIGFDHDTETPEVTLMLISHSRESINDAIQSMKDEKPCLQVLASVCGLSLDAWSNELYKWARESQSFQQQVWLNCWKTYWPGFDAWSMAAMFLQVLKIQLTFPEFVNGQMWKTKGPMIKEMLKGMCRGHPAYRLDAAEALNYLSEGKHPLVAKPLLVNDGSESTSDNAYEWIQEKKARRQAL